MKRIVIFLIILTSLQYLAAKSISGKVVDKHSKAIADVVVTCNGEVDITDKAGNFSISECNDQDKIRFHKIGYSDFETDATSVGRIVIMHREYLLLGTIVRREKRSQPSIIETVEKKIIQIEENEIQGDLASLIDDNSSLIVKGSNLEGDSKTVSLPGFDPKHTLILLDGVVLNKSGEAVDLSTIPLESLEQIEISTMQNGDVEGMAAQVNLISKKGSVKSNNFRYNLGYTFGSFDLNKIRGSVDIDWKLWKLWLYLAHSYARNDFQYEAKDFWENPDSLRTRENNDKRISDVNVSLSRAVGSFNFSYRYLYQNFFKKLPGPTSNPDLYYNSRLTGDLIRHFVVLQYQKSNVHLVMRFHDFSENTTYDNTRIPEPWSSNLFYYIRNSNNYDKLGGQIEVQYKGDIGSISLDQSLERETFSYRESTNALNSIPEDYRDKLKVGLKGVLKQSAGLFDIQEFASYTHLKVSEQEGDNLWNVGFECGYPGDLSIVVGSSLSSNISIPAFYDLYWKGDAQTQGNPDLKAEEGEHWNSWLKIDYRNLTVNGFYKQSEITNKIIWFPNFNQIWKPMNLSGVDIVSWGIDMNVNISKIVDIQAGYTNTEALDRTLTMSGNHSAYWGKQLMYTPEEEISATLNFHPKNFRFAAHHYYRSEQWATRDQLNTQRKIEAYSLTDLSLSCDGSVGNWIVTPSIQLNNIFDKKYEIYEYMPEPGFNFQVGITIKFLQKKMRRKE